MRRALLALCLVGCGRPVASPPPPKPVASAPMPVLETKPLPVDAGAPPATAACKLTGDTTIDDGDGTVDAYGSQDLGSVRILADEAQTIITWTRTSNYAHGDSYQTPNAALRFGAGPFDTVRLPVFSFACATYGFVSPNTRALPLVVWGAMNSHAFEQFAKLPSVAKDPYSETGRPYSKADRRMATPKQDVGIFVASHDVALADLTEMSCESSCQCSESWKDALWLRSLDPAHPFATRVVAGKTDALAFTLGDSGGIAAWRAKEELFFLRVDASGKPIGAPTSFAKGDVGAPAVAMSGSDPILVWASREDSKGSYQLHWMKIGTDPKPIPTRASAFAPALIADEHTVVLAWMEGDSGKVGEIHAVRTSLAHPSFAGTAVISGSETNARDPELSGSVDQPAVVWQTFTKEKAAGVLRTGRLDCGK